MTDSPVDAIASATFPSLTEAVSRGTAVPLHGPGYRQRPADLYRQMRRAHGPVVPILLEGGVPAWYIIGYRELHQVQSDAELFARDPRRWNRWEQVPPDWPLMPFVAYQPALICTEGAEYRRRIGAVSDALASVDRFELRAVCEQIGDALIDRFAGSGTADLMADYADPLPTLVVTRMLGIPDQDAQDLMRDTSIAADNSAESMDGFQRMAARMGRLVADKRRCPGHDVTSHLLKHPAGMTDEELVPDLMLLMSGGHETTANWIGNTLHLVFTDDRFTAKVAGGRSSVGEALNEVLWEDAPLQSAIGRWATRATELGGQRIQTGDLLVLGLAAANSDPRIRPASYAAMARNQAHMAFNTGDHSCPHPAREIAEVMAQTAIELILDRLPDIDLAVPADALEWRDSLWVRGLTALPVRFTPGRVTRPAEPPR